MKYYVLEIIGDVEPELHGPFSTWQKRDEKARDLRSDDAEKENGLFRLSQSKSGKLELSCYGGAELQDEGCAFNGAEGNAITCQNMS